MKLFSKKKKIRGKRARKIEQTEKGEKDKDKHVNNQCQMIAKWIHAAL